MKYRWILVLVSVVLAVVNLVLTLSVMSAPLAAESDIVISEVMYNAVIEGSGEWVEIYNKGTTSVDLTGWQIRDNTVTDTITTAMCPGKLCSIPAGECWLIARSQTHLQNEFDNYTSPLSPTVDISRTIFLDGYIGGGLANDTDNVILKNSSDGNVDCVSWANTAGTVCGDLSYVAGGNGKDTNLNDAADGQAITNIQGTWHEHQSNASPYNCSNTAEGGSPTAITLSSLTVHSEPSTAQVGVVLVVRSHWFVATLGGIAVLVFTIVTLRRRRLG